MKKLFLSIAVTALAFLLSWARSSSISAQSPTASPIRTAVPSPTTVISDYAKDVQDGQRETANDKDAQENQKGAKENENTEGREEGEVENAQESIDQKEAVESNEALNGEEGTDKSGSKEDSNQKSISGDNQQTDIQNSDSSGNNKSHGAKE